MMKGYVALGMAALAMASLADATVSETLKLKAGWNGVYLESTPTSADCDDFFADMPAVMRVGGYVSDAYESTEQIDSEGNTINQKPISYFVWRRDKPQLSSLKSLRGGHCYLVYATNECSKTFLGEPGVPCISWRAATASEGLANLVGPSLPPEVTDMTVTKYFRDGPAGSSAGVWQITGKGEAPELLPLGIFSTSRITPGLAYVMTAQKAGSWPGVVEVSGAQNGIIFSSNGTDQVGFWLCNRGSATNTFEISYGNGADGSPAPKLSLYMGDSWMALTNDRPIRLTFEPGAQRSMDFALDRSLAGNNAFGGGVLTISDLGATKMRVRLPVKAEPKATSSVDAAWPCGFWGGSMRITAVNFYTNSTPQAAGGEVKASILMSWSATNVVHLLQRVSYGVDSTNASVRFFRSLETAKATMAADSKIQRLSCVLLDPDQPDICATPKDGTTLVYEWTVGKYGSTNPMRHSWHPDHDGVTYTSSGGVELAPDGDDLKNYTYPVKPELFSIGNKVKFVFDNTTWTPNETLTGKVRWELTGLKSAVNGPVICEGTFQIKRLSSNAELE